MAAYAIVASNPLTGAGLFLANQIFSEQIDQFSSARYAISGKLSEPTMELNGIFDNRMGEGGAPEAGTAAGDAAEPPSPDEPSGPPGAD